MGCKFCESKNNNNPPQNQHRETIPDDGYQSLNIPNQNQKQNKTKKSEQLITPTPDPENHFYFDFRKIITILCFLFFLK